jgi:uncharacterized membrane protein YhaH (DUF805 family)
MSAMAVRAARRRQRMFTYLWTFLLAVGTISLIYWELTAVLYILATLGVTILLVVVGMADLAHAEQTPGSSNVDPTAPIRSGGR